MSDASVYRIRESQLGPVPMMELRNVVAAGQIGSAVAVWREGMAGLGILGGLVGALVASACGGVSTVTSGGGSSDAGGSCSELADSARQEIDAVVEAHRACTVASDCVGVARSASCFDSCGTTMRADSQTALSEAKAKVDKAQCAQFTSKGCKLIIPPCAPPLAPACVSGVCTGS